MIDVKIIKRVKESGGTRVAGGGVSPSQLSAYATKAWASDTFATPPWCEGQFLKKADFARMFVWDGATIKALAPLYSVGDVSAFGSGGSSSGGGTGSGGGLDEASLAAYLDEHGYATQSWVGLNFAAKNHSHSDGTGGGTVDLSGYLTKSEADGLYAANNHTHSQYLTQSVADGRYALKGEGGSGGGGITFDDIELYLDGWKDKYEIVDEGQLNDTLSNYLKTEDFTDELVKVLFNDNQNVKDGLFDLLWGDFYPRNDWGIAFTGKTLRLGDSASSCVTLSYDSGCLKINRPVYSTGDMAAMAPAAISLSNAVTLDKMLTVDGANIVAKGTGSSGFVATCNGTADANWRASLVGGSESGILSLLHSQGSGVKLWSRYAGTELGVGKASGATPFPGVNLRTGTLTAVDGKVFLNDGKTAYLWLDGSALKFTNGSTTKTVTLS